MKNTKLSVLTLLEINGTIYTYYTHYTIIIIRTYAFTENEQYNKYIIYDLKKIMHKILYISIMICNMLPTKI